MLKIGREVETMAQEKTVAQVAKLCGISVRTLHYYDEIGLLRPGRVNQAGFRGYGEEEILRLQQILLLREMEFPLKQIARILQSPSYEEETALKQQEALLMLKRQRLDRILELVRKRLKGEPIMDLKAFDGSELKRAQERYAQETREKYGNTEAYRQSIRRMEHNDDAGWQALGEGMKEIFSALAACREEGPESPRARQLVERWQRFITENYYDCTDEILAGLGQMYVADERFTRNIDSVAPGLAAFFSKAIESYCAAKKEKNHSEKS